MTENPEGLNTLGGPCDHSGFMTVDPHDPGNDHGVFGKSVCPRCFGTGTVAFLRVDLLDLDEDEDAFLIWLDDDDLPRSESTAPLERDCPIPMPEREHCNGEHCDCPWIVRTPENTATPDGGAA